MISRNDLINKLKYVIESDNFDMTSKLKACKELLKYDRYLAIKTLEDIINGEDCSKKVDAICIYLKIISDDESDMGGKGIEIQ